MNNVKYVGMDVYGTMLIDFIQGTRYARRNAT
jgi:hypothetical protein